MFTSRGTFPSMDALKQTVAWKSDGRLHLIPSGTALPQSNSMGLCYYHELSPGKEKKTINIELIYCHDAKPEQVWHMRGFPLAPLSFMLLRKLEKWGEAAKRRHIVDMDMRQLLGLFEMYQPDDIPFSSELHESSRSRVQAFASAFPESVHAWRRLGFESTLVDTSRAAAAIPSSRFEELSGASGTSGHDTERLMIENPSRIQMIFLAALTTVIMLHKLGFSCAVYGSLACFLYGNLREPNVCAFPSTNIALADRFNLQDVDILVLPPPHSVISVEKLKLAIEHLDPIHFYLIPSKRPRATYQVLYYRLNDASIQTVSTSCKVDLVFPGTLHLPALPTTRIFWDEGLPLIPFSLLLLQKLQGWDDHRVSGEEVKRLKQITDAKDIQGLLELSGMVSLRFSRPWSDRLLFDEQFEMLSRGRVRLYCFMFPEWAEHWELLGFDVPL